MVAPRIRHEHKRHGRHQKRTGPFLKVYWPYLPLAMVIGLGLVFTILWQPHTKHGVLAYATSMSVSALLQTTNQDRADNGIGALNLNSKLTSAAQAKANDMVARNYWSHNTPDGNPPWVFIDNAGYKYTSAGENLAYGFLTSSDTVAGWMNSAEHRANMLNSQFKDVGFGFANSSNFQNTGEETVVVAMYAAPVVIAPLATASKPPTYTATTEPRTLADSQNKPSVAAPKLVKSKTAPVAISNLTSKNVASAVIDPPTKSVSRLETLTAGSIPWLATFSSMTLTAALSLFAMRHALALHKWLRKGERYLLSHAVFDVTIVSLVGLIIIINQSAGFIR